MEIHQNSFNRHGASWLTGEIQFSLFSGSMVISRVLKSSNLEFCNILANDHPTRFFVTSIPVLPSMFCIIYDTSIYLWFWRLPSDCNYHFPGPKEWSQWPLCMGSNATGCNWSELPSFPFFHHFLPDSAHQNFYTFLHGQDHKYLYTFLPERDRKYFYTFQPDPAQWPYVLFYC